MITLMRTLTLWLMLVGLGLRVEAQAPAQATTLKDASRNLFEIGVGINDRIADRPADHRLLLSQFAVVTPENCMKPAQVHPAEGKWDFAQADRFVDFATKKNLKVVGHCLVWAKDRSEERRVGKVRSESR